MNPLSSLNRPVESPGISYSDIRSLQRIDTRDDDGIEAAAQQFESLFIGLMLKSMREANAVFAEGNPLSSPELTMHQEMLDQQWAIHMAENGGIGLAGIIEAQLRGERRAVDRESPTARAPDLPTRKTPAEAAPERAAGFATREEFVAAVLPEIENAVRGTNLDPRHVLAQSALETGWGSRIPQGPGGTSSHNLFGIKAGADWQGPGVEVRTLEVIDGRLEQQLARFRAYPDVASSVRDYVQFLERHERYREVLRAPDADGFARAIGDSGYATDPAYARKVRAVIDSVIDLTGA